jgi:hypothetical protein
LYEQPIKEPDSVYLYVQTPEWIGVDGDEENSACAQHWRWWSDANPKGPIGKYMTMTTLVYHGNHDRNQNLDVASGKKWKIAPLPLQYWEKMGKASVDVCAAGEKWSLVKLQQSDVLWRKRDVTQPRLR